MLRVDWHEFITVLWIKTVNPLFKTSILFYVPSARTIHLSDEPSLKLKLWMNFSILKFILKLLYMYFENGWILKDGKSNGYKFNTKTLVF